MKKYSVILADPPWPFGRSRKHREWGYPLLSMRELNALPVEQIAAEN